jgi:hypothetical protein
MASILSPASALWASAGFAWWRRDVVPARSRGVFACLSASVDDPPRGGLHQKYGRRQPAAPNTKAGEFETGAGAGSAAPARRRHHRDDHDLHRLAAALGAGFFAGVVRKKLALRLESEKTDGERVYRIVAGKTSADAAGQPSA